ncbi:MAG: NUDIX domain-containing protein [Patescibacteria group bacterium]|nr:NUDIX domain-containing protein [Patescibacteria group bacterium]MDD4304191.1 NUDIX domain-containing protein [Patescibacteria group bacterium]MDD4695223.1 NUDIX domain-containing protein [Patescibacteria group bacterium]
MKNNITQRPTAIIVKDNKILLMHRIKNGKEYYAFPGGHIEGGENIKETFLREMKEELNFKISKYKKIVDIYDNTILNNEKRKHIFFLVEKFSGNLKLGGPEIERMKKGNNNYYPTWYSKNEFKKLSPVYPRGIKKFVLEKIF